MKGIQKFSTGIPKLPVEKKELEYFFFEKIVATNWMDFHLDIYLKSYLHWNKIHLQSKCMVHTHDLLKSL